MANQMLVDATHPEETRVVVVRGNRVEEFDFESANRKQLRGNIYLAKVTRVEPSLQAAFVDYGGNRHGFLAFSEIHPDYYQIPVADRQALLEEEKHHDDDEADSDNGSRAVAADASDEKITGEVTGSETSEDNQDGMAGAADDSADDADATPSANDDNDADEDGNGINVEQVGAEDAMEEVPERRSRRRTRQYKIQEVIKRRQILLVQVVKEERGNKGAALTTYLSLAGRYSVLMPNTARGGGISRKITNVTDRKRLKQIASDLDVADGMGVILRTAGASRTKTEIKRDFEYLLRLWENVRDLTLKSAAPLLVYEEGSLIKRSIRDLYNKDIDQVLVAGEEGYKEAKGFMRMLMPSHARNVQPYREPQPVFTRHGIESQLDAMFSPQVTLKSGGYIVIDQTEALVSIDVNSGRSTREHNIEDTALSTNLEAAEEISRQLRLRDLAGLVVIDFIDMEEKRNNRAVEKRLKDCLKSDRARIQVGRISHFGLMEMSRQRIRASVLESTMDPCPHCHGTGYVRAAASVALLVLRTIEDHLLKGVAHHVVVKTRTNVALYILNQKRGNLNELEARFGVHISIEVEENLEGKHLEIERGEALDKPVAATPTVSMLTHDELMDSVEDEIDADDRSADEENNSKKRRRRRRRRKPGQDRENSANEANETDIDGEEDPAAEDSIKDDDTSEEGDDKPKRSRRRGRRGGRRNRRNRDGRRNDDGDFISDEAVQAAPMAALVGREEKGRKSDQAQPADEVETRAIKTVEEAADIAATSDDQPLGSEVVEAPGANMETPALSVEEAVEPSQEAPIKETEASEQVEAVKSTGDHQPTSEADTDVAPEQEAVSVAQADADADTTGPSETEFRETEAASHDDNAEESASQPAEETFVDAAGQADGENRDEAPITEPVQEPEAQPEEKPRPKRSGWWNRGFL